MRRRPLIGRPFTRGQAVVEFALILPIVMFLLIAIGDFARVYATALTVEAGVREGADYGGFQRSNWLPTNTTLTRSEIERRVCAASSTLPDYLESGGTCTNPGVTIELLNPDNVTSCADEIPAGMHPCLVHVGAVYDFQLILGGVGFGPFSFPRTVQISREAYYAVNDFPTS